MKEGIIESVFVSPYTRNSHGQQKHKRSSKPNMCHENAYKFQTSKIWIVNLLPKADSVP